MHDQASSKLPDSRKGARRRPRCDRADRECGRRTDCWSSLGPVNGLDRISFMAPHCHRSGSEIIASPPASRLNRSISMRHLARVFNHARPPNATIARLIRPNSRQNPGRFPPLDSRWPSWIAVSIPHHHRPWPKRAGKLPHENLVSAVSRQAVRRHGTRSGVRSSLIALGAAGDRSRSCGVTAPEGFPKSISRSSAGRCQVSQWTSAGRRRLLKNDLHGCRAPGFLAAIRYHPPSMRMPLCLACRAGVHGGDVSGTSRMKPLRVRQRPGQIPDRSATGRGRVR